jgi:hypothetical protein
VVLPATVTEVRFIGVARLVRVLASPPNGPALDLQVRAPGTYAPEVGAKVGLSLDPAQAFVFGPEQNALRQPLAEPRPNT